MESMLCLRELEEKWTTRMHISQYLPIKCQENTYVFNGQQTFMSSCSYPVTIPVPTLALQVPGWVHSHEFSPNC